MGDQNLLSRAPPCFGMHVKPLVPAAFAVVSTHQSALGPRGGLWPVLWVIHKKGLCPSSGDINRHDDDNECFMYFTLSDCTFFILCIGYGEK
jgi:hypothetical protein